jgi:hypothetical protein
MQKLVAAENIVARDEAALGRKFDVKPRNQIIKNLATKSLDDILATPVGSSTLAAAIGVGDTTDRIFAVVGGPFNSQGGSTTNCNARWPGPAAAVFTSSQFARRPEWMDRKALQSRCGR